MRKLGMVFVLATVAACSGEKTPPAPAGATSAASVSASDYAYSGGIRRSTP